MAKTKTEVIHDNGRLRYLLARTALGDGKAFQDLYLATSPQLFGVLLRLLKRKDWAEDALQETFVRVWQESTRYNAERGKPFTWLASIARYRAIDLLRKYRPETVMPFDELLHESADEGATGYSRFMELNESRLDKCLRLLKPKHREAIVMAFCEGYTHSELAVRMASPAGTVKSWIRRGLRSLKKCLES